MRSQHPGMSQPRPNPNQQHGSNDRQLWQQHMMFKQLQLQEMQRQRQLQQPNLGGRQHNTLSQLSDVARQSGIGHSTPVLSGMPINNASEYTLSSGHMGGEPRAMNNSLMFNTGNMSWAQRPGNSVHGISSGLVFSPDQGQTMRPIGFVQQHDEQSLYGIPVPNTRYFQNHYPQSQGMSHDRTGVMHKGGGGSSQEKVSMQPSASNYFQNDQCVFPEHGRVEDSESVTKQGFQGNSLFGNAPVHGLNSGSMLGNVQQMNHFMQSVQAQEFQGGQDRDNWSGRLQVNKLPVVGHPRSVANLNPTEDKLLLGIDNDGHWNGSFGQDSNTNTGINHHVNPMQNNDHNSAFPSIQSGSWSALMLDALDASSSDTGLQEEWSGLMKTEPSTQNHYAMLNPNEKQQLSWDEKNLSLTSRTLPLFNDADASPSHHAFSSLQQSSSKFAYEHNEIIAAEVSRESSEQSSKEAKNKKFDQNPQQKQFVRSSIQDQTSFDNVSNGAWVGQIHRQLVNTRHSADMESNMLMRNGNSLSSDKSNGWNVNQSPIGDNTSNIPDNDDTKGYAQWDNIKKKEPVISEIGSPKMHGKNSNKDDYAAATYSSALKFNQEMKHASDQHWLGYGKHVASDSSLNYQGAESVPTYQDQLSRDQQYRYTSLSSTEKKEASEIFDHKRENINPGDVPNGNCISNHSHSTKHADCESGPREISLSTGNDSGPFFRMSQKSLSQIGQKDLGPHRFQYHTMGNLERDLGPAASHNGTLYSQDPNHSLVRGTKTQEHGYIGRSEIASHVIPPSSMNFGKEHLNDSQRNAEVADRIHSGGTAPSHDPSLPAYDGLATNVSQNIRADQASHNMLELLHKVDQSRNKNNVTHFSFSDHNEPSELPKDVASARSTGLQHDNSSALQGFGLKLGPPSQWQPVSDNDLASQASSQKTNEFGSRNIISDRQDKDRVGSSSTISVPPPHLTKVPHEKFNNWSNIYGHMNKQTPYSGINGNPLTFSNSIHPYSREETAVQQQQRQQRIHVPSVTGYTLSDQSANLSVRGQVNIDDHAKQSTQRKQSQSSSVGNASDQSAQGLLSSVASRIPLSRLNPSRNTCAPTASQFHSLNSGPTQPIYTSSLLVSSGQQLAVAETRSAAPPTTSGMSEQGGFSSMLHKVHSSLSAQQHQSIIQAQNTSFKLPQSMGSSPNRMDTSSWARKADQYSRIGRDAPSESGTCSTNSQQLILAEEYPMKGQSSQLPPTERVDGALEMGGVSRGQEPVSISSLVHLHQQDQNRGKHACDSSLDSQDEHVLNADVYRQNYSLLHQVQAMSDPSKRAGKRLKGENFGANAPQMELAAGQKFIYGQNTVVRKLDAAPQQSTFPSDGKMLSFSRENKDESADTSSQLTSGEKSSKALLTSRTNNLQNHTHFLNKFSTSAFMRENGQAHSQMAPSWFDLYKSYKNGQVIATDVEPGNSQSSAKATALKVEPGNSQSQHHSYAKVSESMDNSALIEHKDAAAQIGVLPQSTLSTVFAAKENSFVQSPPSNVIDNNVVLLPKKRKTATSELLPWHKKLTKGSVRLLQNTSTSQLDWAKAANRMIEKVEEEPEMIEDRSSITRSRKRLILTTQLMQQLLPSVPATFLRADAVISCESVAYSVAKLALGDACSLISCSGNDSLVHSNSGNATSEKLVSSEKARDRFLSKATESFIGRTQKLECDLSRLENKDPMLDVGLECQDLDRCSTINRLAKFHGRAQTNGNESSSTPETGHCKIYPQRNVTAHAMTTDLPSGVRYLSL